jgi:HlyD family secretion protein
MSETTAATEELKRALAAEEGGRRWLRRLAFAGVFAAAIGAGETWHLTHLPPPPPKFVTADAAIGDVAENIQATGTVQPLLQINVGAQVNGRVTQVLVDYNSIVHKGDILAEIDPTIYGTQVTANQAGVSAQRAQLEQAKAQVASLQAQMVTGKVAFNRTKLLYDNNLAAKADLDNAQGNYDSLTAQHDAAIANANAQAAQIQASVANLLQARTNVIYTKIIAPVDGVVVTRSIDPGATVVASFQAPVLFVIAQDLKKMRVLADVDEADVGKIAEKMDADAVVDAFPGDVFHGTVSQIRYSPNTVSGVTTYSAIVQVDNPEEKLRPGMTATITVRTHEAKGVVRIPNAALRYKPSPAKGPDGKPILTAPEPPLAKGTGHVYVLTSDKRGDEKDEQRTVDIGVTDGIFTEIRNDTLKAGTKVVTDETDASEEAQKKRAR